MLLKSCNDTFHLGIKLQMFKFVFWLFKARVKCRGNELYLQSDIY